MSETVVVALVAAVLVIGVLLWIVYVAAASILAFTAFVMGLPTILAILMFIIFPPTFVVFLIGYGMIKFGIADSMSPEKTDKTQIIHADGSYSTVTENAVDESSLSLKRMAVLFVVLIAIVAALVLMK